MIMLLDFIKKYKLPLIGLGLFLPFFFVFIFSLFIPSSKTKNQNTPTPTSRATTSTTPSQVTNNQPAAEGFEKAWTPIAISEDLLRKEATTTETLSDGSTKYIITSENRERPDVIITKNGSAIFMRELVYQMTAGDYAANLGKADYIVHGSRFWGADAITYIYFERGFAFVANPKTGVAFERLTFKPIIPSEFKEKYGEDLLGEIAPAPELRIKN